MRRTTQLERTVDVDFDAALAALRARTRDVVLGDDERFEVAAGVLGFNVTREVVVTLGEVELLEPHVAIVPLSWEAASAGRAFPTAAATLELSAMSRHPAVSQLALLTTVVPPGGPLAAIGDAMGLGGVQADVLRRLLDDVADRLVAAVADGAATQTADALTAGLAHPRFVLPD